MKKLKIHTFNIDHWFNSKQDIELYRKALFPHLIQQHPTPKSEPPTTLWIDETITYLSLGRVGLKRPDKAIHRLIKKGALHPRKISGRLVFSREELDRVLANGDHKKGRGRPRSNSISTTITAKKMDKLVTKIGLVSLLLQRIGDIEVITLDF